MKKLPFKMPVVHNNQTRRFNGRIFAPAMIAIAVLLSSVLTWADDKTNSPAEEAKPDKILITARQLVTNTASQLAEFIGEVRVQQGDTVINADRLKIHYSGGPQNNKAASKEGESIEKIIAQGNVKIQMDNRIAFTDHAVYTTANNVLVLTGKNSRLASGNNTISGSKITFFRADGRVKVEGGEDSRVEAVLFPGDKGLDIKLPQGK